MGSALCAGREPAGGAAPSLRRRGIARRLSTEPNWVRRVTKKSYYARACYAAEVAGKWLRRHAVGFDGVDDSTSIRAFERG